ncbi:hypothetical protein ABIE91_003703 [Bradyrhizobium elkanii]
MTADHLSVRPDRSMIRKGAKRLSRATKVERVCAEIMLNKGLMRDDVSTRFHHCAVRRGTHAVAPALLYNCE